MVWKFSYEIFIKHFGFGYRPLQFKTSISIVFNSLLNSCNFQWFEWFFSLRAENCTAPLISNIFRSIGELISIWWVIGNVPVVSTSISHRNLTFSCDKEERKKNWAKRQMILRQRRVELHKPKIHDYYDWESCLIWLTAPIHLLYRVIYIHCDGKRHLLPANRTDIDSVAITPIGCCVARHC